MKGMIFAAGIGSRLKPWTDKHPKALVPVGDKPVIGHVIDSMLKAGICDIIVNVHHFADQVEEYLFRHYRHINILISDERDLLLDTGGGLLKALPLIGDEPVLIHNADIYTTMNLKELISCHKKSRAEVSLLVQKRNTARYFVFKNSRLNGWTNIETGDVRPPHLIVTQDMELAAFGGLHVINQSVYKSLKEYCKADVPFSITDFYIDSCGTIDINGFHLPECAAWYDVGKPATLEAARQFIKNKQQ